MRDPNQSTGIFTLQKCNLGYLCSARPRRVATRQRRDLPSPVPSRHSPLVIPKVRALALLGFLIALYLAALPSPAHAEPDPRAKPTNPVALEHFQSGNRLFRVREFDKAVAEYKAGAVLEDAPVFQYNLAQAYRMAGRHEEALWHYENFLGRLPQGDPNRAKVEELIAQVKAGRDERRADPPARVKEPPAEKDYVIAAQPREAREPWYADRTGWALSATGSVLAASSVYFLVSARHLDDQALSDGGERERAQLQDRAGTRRTVGYALGISGLVAIGTGVIKLSIHDGPSQSTTVAVAGTF
jgi:tetratricopeptide (TPR) repeat protein